MINSALFSRGSSQSGTFGRFLLQCMTGNTMGSGGRTNLRKGALLSTIEQAGGSSAQLPRLPVPALNKTLEKFLKTVRPLVTEDEYLQTENEVKKFGSPSGIGEKLQALLESKAQNSTNWLADWWLNSAYMEFRYPVVMWSSPGLVGPHQSFKSLEDQLLFSAKMIAGALSYKQMLDGRTIPTDSVGNNPLDMSQYFKIFSTCRIPGRKKDNLIFYSEDPSPPTHIIIARNNIFFKVEVYDKKSGKPLPISALLQQIRDIINIATQPAEPIGILTTENRDVWGRAYEKLMKNETNRKSVKEIQQSIFLMCIDGPNPDALSDDVKTRAALQTIHGCGSKLNSGNRWFDKTIQFITGTQGEVGLTYEHSPAEGVAIANMFDHIFELNDKNKFPDGPLPDSVPKPERLEFVITPDVAEEIEIAKRDIDAMVQDLEMSCFTFKNYGRNFIKNNKLSPDSYIQMAIQLAFYRIHKEIGTCYESAATRQYIYGRTETIRSASEASRDFCVAMLNDTTLDSVRVEALQKAVSSHKQYTAEAMQGRGIDRHFLGLKLTAIENGINIPDLYRDAGYVKSSQFRISTSQVPVRCDGFMCYGPLVINGYGCCYNPRPNDINFGVSSLSSCPETSPVNFSNALAQSLVDMQNLLTRTQKSKL